jgi:hypothetical protein
VVRSEKPDLADGDQTMMVHAPNHADAISEHEVPISPVTHV